MSLLMLRFLEAGMARRAAVRRAKSDLVWRAVMGLEMGGRQRRARQQWDNPDTRELYRVRSQCERLVNQVVRQGGRQARAFGLQSAQLQADAIAMRCNLALFAKQMLSAQQRPVLENAA